METTIYRLGGLRIASDFPLFGLQVCRNEAEARCEVVIRCAPIPEEVASATAKFLDGHTAEIQRKGSIARILSGWPLSSAGGRRNSDGLGAFLER